MVRVYLAFIVILSLFSVGCEDTDVGMALEAGADAVRKAIASQQNEVGDIARSAIGALTENLLNAQFSQQEERKADDFGVMFLKQKGHDIQPAISALMKLAALGGNHSFLSSHPAPAKRAKRLQENASTLAQIEDPSLLNRIVDWLKSHWPFIK
jgi:metalloprotease